jgi:hypothetical protein
VVLADDPRVAVSRTEQRLGTQLSRPRQSAQAAKPYLHAIQRQACRRARAAMRALITAQCDPELDVLYAARDTPMRRLVRDKIGNCLDPPLSGELSGSRSATSATSVRRRLLATSLQRELSVIIDP